MSRNMLSAISRTPGRVEVEEIPLPRPAAGEVLLRVARCGICGSDLHWYHGKYAVPRVCPGHEISAVVAEVGAGVTGVRSGDRVAVEGLRSCGGCARCRSGQTQRCSRTQMIGGTAPGGLAEYMLQAPRHLFPVPAAVDDEIAALTEPLAVSVHGLRLAGLAMGQRVLVLGSGTIGLTAIIAAIAGGAGEVIATAKRPQQRAAALALGAARVFAPTDDAPGERLSEYARKHLVDVVVEAVGDSPSGDTLGQAVACARRGGAIVVLGLFFQPVALNALLLLARELRLIGSVGYSQGGERADFEIALDILERRGEAMRASMITHRFPLAEVGAAFAAAADKAAGAIKVSVRPEA